MSETQALFGDWVARLRRAHDLTQRELADHVGCSVSALRKIESGERRPSREIAELLAAALEVPADQRVSFVNLARMEPHFAESGPHARAVSTMPPAPEVLVAVPPPAAALPVAATPLVGRAHEMETIVALLEDPACRLVTLAGTGGIGKSRLAIQVASTVARAAAGEVHYVDLASLSAPELLAQTIAVAVGCQAPAEAQVLASLLTFLHARRVLLVLDNLEHLVAGVDLLAEVLQHAPDVRILATSRERLNLQGEWVFEVQGLPTPVRAETFEESSAVQLFLQSARRARVGYSPEGDERAAIVEICRMVEGMPLAIELAAGWVRVLSCREIASEIARDQRFLASTARDVPQRHRSITAVFDQSWRLLGDDERILLRRLAVFRGGFEREMAGQVAGASLADLSSLMARSLVRRMGPHRFDMHELVRQYCRERLDESGEAAVVAAAHARALGEVAVAARPELTGPLQTQWLDRLQMELSNIRAALEWCVAASDAGAGLRIAAALLGFWYQRDLQGEGRRWLRELLALDAGADDQDVAAGGQAVLLRVEALATLGYLSYELGEFAEARASLEEALTLLEHQSEPNLLATVLVVLGQVHGGQGEYVAARSVLERALALAQDDVYAQRRRASALMALADVTSLDGDDARAQYIYAASTAIYRDIADTNALAYSLRKWGWSALRCGEREAAEALVRESLQLNRETGSKIGTIACLAALSALHLERGAIAEAARLIAAVEGLIEAHSVRLRPMDVLGLAQAEVRLNALDGGENLARARATYRRCSLEQAVASVQVES